MPMEEELGINKDIIWEIQVWPGATDTTDHQDVKVHPSPDVWVEKSSTASLLRRNPVRLTFLVSDVLLCEHKDLVPYTGC